MRNPNESTLEILAGPEKGRFYHRSHSNLLGTRVLGHCFRAFTDRVLRQFTRQQEPHSRLYLPGGDRRALVVMRQSRRLRGDSFENVVYKAIHDAHGFAGDPGVRMYLLQYFVDVNGVALLPLPLLLLVGLTNILLGLAGLLHRLATRFRGHLFVQSECLRMKPRYSVLEVHGKNELKRKPELLYIYIYIYLFPAAPERQSKTGCATTCFYWWAARCPGGI